MSNPLSGKQRESLDQQRRRWLEAHPDILHRLPSLREDVEDDRRVALGEAYNGLKAAGLIGKSTLDTSRHNIRRIVSQIRGHYVARWMN